MKKIETALTIAIMLAIPVLALASSSNPFEPAQSVMTEVQTWMQKIGLVIAATMIIFGGIQVFVFGKADMQRFFMYLIGALLIGLASQIPAWITSFAS